MMGRTLRLQLPCTDVTTYASCEVSLDSLIGAVVGHNFNLPYSNYWEDDGYPIEWFIITGLSIRLNEKMLALELSSSKQFKEFYLYMTGTFINCIGHNTIDARFLALVKDLEIVERYDWGGLKYVTFLQYMIDVFWRILVSVCCSLIRVLEAWVECFVRLLRKTHNFIQQFLALASWEKDTRGKLKFTDSLVSLFTFGVIVLILRVHQQSALLLGVPIISLGSLACGFFHLDDRVLKGDICVRKSERCVNYWQEEEHVAGWAIIDSRRPSFL
ncbi:hypothetical protein Ancab_016208 [Ancistrocladus abbreviatus]